MEARLLLRVAFHLPVSFLFGTSVHKKTQKHALKHSRDMVKLRSQFALVKVSITIPCRYHVI